MSAISHSRRNWIIAAVLSIGLLVGAAELVVYETWSEWENVVFTPLTPQVRWLGYGVISLLNANWDDSALMLPVGALLFAAATFMAVAQLLVSESKRRSWARIMLILLVLSSAIGWWLNWHLLHWGPNNSWRIPLACVSGVLLALCLIANRYWRRNPDGRAAFWYPVSLQIWIQSVWIPWPDVD